MEVIFHGVPDGESWHKGKCLRCNSTFKFQKKEFEVNSDQRDGDYFVIPNCPVCKKRVIISVSNSRFTPTV